MLTADNGLMIGGLADAARILKNDRYLAAATKAADFVLANLRTKEGRLLRTYSKAGEEGGKAKLNAYVDDYAFLVDGLLRLHQATADKKWLTAAEEITAKQIELFQDEKSGGFYFTSSDHEALFARGKNPAHEVEILDDQAGMGPGDLALDGKFPPRRQHIGQAAEMPIAG